LTSLFFFLDLGLLIPKATPSEVAEIVDSSSLSVFFLVARSLLGLVEESIVMLAKEVSRTVVPLGSKIENWQPEKPKIVGDWVF
jgi:formate-dependent phosphoribosylglycinamide formyltransferase (GAR transformylase)